MGGSFSVFNDLNTTIDVRHFTTGGGIALKGKARKRGAAISIPPGEEHLITDEVPQGSYFYFEITCPELNLKAGSNFYSAGNKTLRASEILQQSGVRLRHCTDMEGRDDADPQRSTEEQPDETAEETNGDASPSDEEERFIQPIEASQEEGMESIRYLPDVQAEFFSSREDMNSEIGHPMVLTTEIPYIFDALLSDASDFALHYHKKRKDENVVVSPWVLADGTSAGRWGGLRMVTLIGTTTFGPKPYHEGQRYIYTKKDGAEVLTYHRSGQVPGILYGDSFRTESLHIFEKPTPTSPVTLRSYARVNFVKHCPALLRGTIGHAAIKAIKTSAPLFESCVRQYMAAYLASDPPPIHRQTLRPRTISPPASDTESTSNPEATPPPRAPPRRRPPQITTSSPSTLPTRLVIVLLVLVALLLGVLVGLAVSSSLSSQSCGAPYAAVVPKAPGDLVQQREGLLQALAELQLRISTAPSATDEL